MWVAPGPNHTTQQLRATPHQWHRGVGACGSGVGGVMWCCGVVVLRGGGVCDGVCVRFVSPSPPPPDLSMIVGLSAQAPCAGEGDRTVGLQHDNLVGRGTGSLLTAHVCVCCAFLCVRGLCLCCCVVRVLCIPPSSLLVTPSCSLLPLSSFLLPPTLLLTPSTSGLLLPPSSLFPLSSFYFLVSPLLPHQVAGGHD